VALSPTLHRFEIELSDVDRGVYASLDFRAARHPSESARYLWTRVIAYALSFEEGSAFSKGGLSQTDEPPVSVRDPTGVLLAWIDVGSPSADRLHAAAKAARRVALFTSSDLAALRKEMRGRSVHRAAEIQVVRIEPELLTALEGKLDRHLRVELLRNDGRLYATIDGSTFEGSIETTSLLAAVGEAPSVT